MGVNINRDAVLWFFYENTLIILYFLGYRLHYVSLLDNEIPLEMIWSVFVGGGYPELHNATCKCVARIGVLIRWFELSAYLECGGYIVLAQWILVYGKYCRMVGFLSIINNKRVKLKLILDKSSSLKKWNCVCGTHEFHYVDELSKTEPYFGFMARTRHQLNLSGNSHVKITGSYLHIFETMR
ncbi:hypothetical protein ACA081_00535 [Candidatus Hodgkinia cicadicola]